MPAGLGADLGVAAAAFVGTNVDNCVVTMAMVAGAPLRRAHRIAAGQVVGFVVVVAVSAAGAAVLYEFSPAVVGLLGLVPLAIGVSGLLGLARRRAGTDSVPAAAPTRRSRRWRRRPEDRAVGQSLTAAALVTVAAGGDNLAVYGSPILECHSARAAERFCAEKYFRGWCAIGTDTPYHPLKCACSVL